MSEWIEVPTSVKELLAASGKDLDVLLAKLEPAPPDPIWDALNEDGVSNWDQFWSHDGETRKVFVVLADADDEAEMSATWNKLYLLMRERYEKLVNERGMI